LSFDEGDIAKENAAPPSQMFIRSGAAYKPQYALFLPLLQRTDKPPLVSGGLP
jgi:hypothetical protein